eukprot:COSAG02_NODE_9200_length_2291_cov_1.577555_1_plen_65_part_10
MPGSWRDTGHIYEGPHARRMLPAHRSYGSLYMPHGTCAAPMHAGARARARRVRVHVPHTQPFGLH